MATLSKGQKTRIPALDFIKGALVLFMVLYHFLNYFVSASGDYYRYIRFVTPSFIFITGFLISNVYFSRYLISDPKLATRLAQRGLKILAVFVGLNLLISLSVQESYSGAISFGRSLRNLTAVFVTGNIEIEGGKACAFYILVPISYLLLMSAALVIVYRRQKYVFHAVSAALFVGVLLLHLIGQQSANLELLAIGLLGVIAGHASMETVYDLVGRRYALAGAYAGYLAAITVWDATYPMQVVGVCLTLMVICLVAISVDPHNRWTRTLVLLGRYSLFGYIAQIVLLQLLHRGLQPVDLGPILLVLLLPIAIGLTILSVTVLEWARARSAAVDAIYKAVFS